MAGSRIGMSDEEAKRFSLNMKRFREALGLSKQQVAFAARVSVGYIDKLENKTPRRPSYEELNNVLALYGRTYDDAKSENPGAPDPSQIPAFILFTHPLAKPSLELVTAARSCVDEVNARYQQTRRSKPSRPTTPAAPAR